VENNLNVCRYNANDFGDRPAPSFFFILFL
jgi:hypothetical protein